ALKAAVSNFNAGAELKGTSISGMKQQLNDYLTVIDANITANDADVEDFQTLSSTAGGEVIDGTAILDEWDSAKEGKASAERAADNARGWASFFRIIDAQTANILENNAKVYDAQADTWQEIITWCQEQADTFDQIKSTTDGLFVTGPTMRETAASALADIAGAFRVNGYSPNMNAGWRTSIQELSVERQVIDKAKEDYEAGKISKETFESIRGGIIGTTSAFLRESLVAKVQELGADATADAIYTWIKNNTTAFMNRGLVAAYAQGGEALFSETPSWAATAVRGSAKYAAPAIGAALDFGLQVASGENAVDAGVKAVSHTAIGVAGAKAGLAIGTAIGGPIGAAVGAGAGFVIGGVGSMAFDYLYDNKDVIIKEVSSIISDIGQATRSWFGGIGDAIFT
ncbi:MAG: hypothetical protein PHQ72_12455, partial [Hespellia sp.]|nr:hypothetical protein [Hespellia sp.]